MKSTPSLDLFILTQIGQSLRYRYEDIVAAPLPASMLQQLAKLDRALAPRGVDVAA